jgi:hypothetical protein
MITAAAPTLAAGAPRRAEAGRLRDDAPALALRGIAMAQLGDLGDFVQAKTLLRRAARAFGPHESMARAHAGSPRRSPEGRPNLITSTSENSCRRLLRLTASAMDT